MSSKSKNFNIVLCVVLFILPASLFSQIIQSGSISGLFNGAGLILQIDGTQEQKIDKNGPFTVKLPGPESIVTIKEQPVNLRCLILNPAEKSKTKKIEITCPLAYVNSHTWMRCTQGQKWNVQKGDCTGIGKTPSFGATQLRFCGNNDNSCNGGTNEGMLDSGEIYDSCNSLNSSDEGYGIAIWRVPSSDELRSLVLCTDGTPTPLHDYGKDPYKCGYLDGNYKNGIWKSPALDQALFPNSKSLEYWSSTPDRKHSDGAWYTAFQNGWSSYSAKSGRSYVRCIAD